MSAKHTPGPLFAQRGFVFRKKDRHIPLLERPTVADCSFVGAGEQAEQDANAVLFAAAPELLEALIGLMPFISEDFPEGFPEVSSGFPVTHGYAKAFIAARAAIAKARGE